jgi:hypothetical protein
MKSEVLMAANILPTTVFWDTMLVMLSGVQGVMCKRNLLPPSIGHF